MRKWILVAAAMFVLVAAAATVLVARLNAFIAGNRERVARQAGSVLAREVRFDDMGVSLWGGLGVRVTGLRIAEDPRLDGGDFVRADRVFVQVRMLPALLGRYEIGRIDLDAPEIAVVRTEAGFNFDSIGRRVDDEPGAPAPASPARPRTPAVGVADLLVSEIVIRNAHIRYFDRRVSPPAQLAVDDLDLTATDLSATRPAEVAISATLFASATKNFDVTGSIGPFAPGIAPGDLALDLSLTLGPVAIDELRRWEPAASALPARLSSRDPIELHAKAQGTLDLLDLELGLDASRAAIRYGETFDKPRDVPLELALRASTTRAAVDVTKADLRLGNVRAVVSGRVFPGAAPALDLHIDVPVASLSGWQSMLPACAGCELAGEVEGRLRARGEVGGGRVPPLEGTITVRELAISGSSLLPDLAGLTATATFDGDNARIPDTRFTLAGSPVTARAALRSFGHPVVEIDATAAELPPAALGLTFAEPTDALGDVRLQAEMRAAAREASATITSGAGRLLGIEYRDFDASLSLGSGILGVERARLLALGGTLVGHGHYDTRAEHAFDLDAAVRDVAVGSLLALRRSRNARSVEGRLRGDLDLRGAGRDWPTVRRSLTGNGRLAIDDGVLKDVNVAEGVLDGLTTISGLTQFASPRLRQKYPELFGAADTRFEELGGTVTLADGRMRTDDLTLRTTDYAAHGKGWFDLDRRVDLKATLVATEQLTEDIVADVRAARYLANDANRLEIPFRLRGKIPGAKARPEADLVARILQRALVEQGLGNLLGGERRDRTPRRGDSTKDLLKKGLRDLLGR